MKQITIRDGKDRRTMLPEKLIPMLRIQVERVKNLHQQDMRDGYGEVYCPTPFLENILMPHEKLPGNIYFLAP